MLASNGLESLNDVLAQWVKEYGPQVLRTIRSRGVPHGDANDVMQDVWIKVFQYRRDGKPMPTHPEGWLKKIAIHAVVDYFRKRGADARGRTRLGNSGKVRSSYCPSTEDEQAAILRRLLPMLDGDGSSDRSLKVVEKRLFKEYTFAQIADLFGVTDVTARRWYQQGLQRLRQALEDQSMRSLPEQS